MNGGGSQTLLLFLVVVAIFVGILFGWWLVTAMSGAPPAPTGVLTTLLA